MPAFGEDYGGDGDDDQDDAGGGAEGECLGEGQDAYDHGGEGLEGTEDGAEGGADALDGGDEGDVGDGGAEQGDAEDIGPEEAVGEGHPADSAGEHTDEGEADGTEAHHVDGQGEGRHVLDGCLAHADDVGAIGNDGECGPENTGGDIAVLEPDVASCQKAGSDQGEYDGTDLDPGAGFVEDRHHDGGHEERVHEVNRRGNSAGDVLVGYQQADGGQGTEEADGQQRKPGTLRDAEGLAHEQAHGQQHEGSHTPAVGEHLERREARIHEGD